MRRRREALRPVVVLCRSVSPASLAGGREAPASLAGGREDDDDGRPGFSFPGCSFPPASLAGGREGDDDGRLPAWLAAEKRTGSSCSAAAEKYISPAAEERHIMILNLRGVSSTARDPTKWDPRPGANTTPHVVSSWSQGSLRPRSHLGPTARGIHRDGCIGGLQPRAQAARHARGIEVVRGEQLLVHVLVCLIIFQVLPKASKA